MTLSFFAPCPRGLEPFLADQLGALGAKAVETTPGGVAFGGDWTVCYRANLESRLATRVMWRIAQGRYRSEEDIYRLAYGPTWAKWFTPDDTTRDPVTLYLDTSGEPLYKRGFKQAAVEAPLKENLAAGILRLTGWQPGEALIDPMCGSGTFLIEAAQMALDIA